ncbi:hypothetical protein BDQ12DRAFT_700603 [Crucibulum laeve]|uniref:Nephrocystin 3-like N-terminal domain-containing protein n=1 Tax=Crucibulum laeve TaxID=68775 RepID=A0A5C3LLA2_9AGAR|nr:hypothetical protein BDQ12DRAFT_700603 [Crucibulum laeve]
MAFAGAKHVLINELTQFDIQVRAEDSKAKIDAIAEGAFHNSAERFDPPNCHPETRKAIIKAIGMWVNNQKRTSSIMWLYGPTGAGKSAILQRVAEICNNEKKLCASFFFSRTVAMRNNYTHLFSTIIYQIVLAIPETKPFVVQAIEKDLTLFSQSLEVQIRSLILDPLVHAMSTGAGLSRKLPQLILIDGLDECVNKEGQVAILKAISCIKLLTTSLALDQSINPNKDIEVFLRSCFIDIKQSHTMRPFSELWPSNDVIDTLVKRSSGQFIYASVVMKPPHETPGCDSRIYPLWR